MGRARIVFPPDGSYPYAECDVCDWTAGSSRFSDVQRTARRHVSVGPFCFGKLLKRISRWIYP